MSALHLMPHRLPTAMPMMPPQQPTHSQPVPKALPKGKKNPVIVRKAGGRVWVDDSLADWPSDDYRLFAGDLGNEVTDELLANAFRKYPSFQKAKVIKNRLTGQSRGYGFISFGKPEHMVAGLTEVNGKYIGSRPVTLKKSKWKDRALDSERNKKAADLDAVVSSSSRELKKFRKLKHKQNPEEQAAKVRAKKEREANAARLDTVMQTRKKARR